MGVLGCCGAPFVHQGALRQSDRANEVVVVNCLAVCRHADGYLGIGLVLGLHGGYLAVGEVVGQRYALGAEALGKGAVFRGERKREL